MTMRATRDLAEVNSWSEGTLPGLFGIAINEIGDGVVRASMTIRPDLLAPNSYLHAGTLVTLADTACGYGTVATLPDGASGFTTLELKTNFISTLREGMLTCVATRIHGGRTTQVWDATVSDAATDRVLAVFRCTQLLLYPR